MKIIVGLGNPGNRYKMTRHNVGFWVINKLSKQWSISLNKQRFHAELGEGYFYGEKIFLIKPQTYMNLSGQSVEKIVNYMQFDLSDLIIIYDDLALESGIIRLKAKGSSGGQKGMRNIIDRLGTEQICRMRIGIGPISPYLDAAQYVLQKPQSDELKRLQDAVDLSVLAIEKWLKFGIEKAMSEYNRKNEQGLS